MRALADAQVYLHSRRSDFAQTEQLSPREYLARPLQAGLEGPLCWGRCRCARPQLVRLRRAWWMRWLPVPLLRLYGCRSCGQQVLRLRTRPRSGYGAVYLPAPPLRANPERLLGLLARLPPPWVR